MGNSINDFFYSKLHRVIKHQKEPMEEIQTTIESLEEILELIKKGEISEETAKSLLVLF